MGIDQTTEDVLKKCISVKTINSLTSDEYNTFL